MGVFDRRTFLASAAVCAAACSQANVLPGERRASLSGFAVNLESWYLDTLFLGRFDRAARDGFAHVELWVPEGEDRTTDDIGRMARDAGLSIAQIVGEAPELARSDPGTRESFLEMCRKTVDRAKRLDAPVATIVGHNSIDGISKADSLLAYADHLAAAAPIFESAGVIAAIEPFNPFNHPGHFLYGAGDAISVVQTVNSPAIKINWDLFHMQRYEGELIGNLRKAGNTVGYAQLADAPDRMQPGTGDVNYANVLKYLRNVVGYTKPIGLEFWAADGDYDRAVWDMVNLARQMEG